MKIIIADDHPLYKEGLINLLQAEGFEIVASVDNGEVAVRETLAQEPDLVLMDISMPVIDGIEATRRIRAELPDIKIIILTSFEEEDSLIKAIKAGASGYLLKSIDGEELIESLYEIKKGKNPFSSGLEDCLLRRFQAGSGLPEVEQKSRKGKTEVGIGDENIVKQEITADVLTERQQDVVRLLVEGLTYREIGEKLFLSESTIKYHMERIKERLGLNTQAQVIAYIKENYC
ncbi:MAG: response regulator [Halanaerobiales bacterium]